MSSPAMLGGDAGALASRIKALEQRYEGYLHECQPYVIRLDGCAFKNYTAAMKKPFDMRLTRSLVSTACELLEKTGARTAFCQSDEISLVYAPESGSKFMPYNGRTLKLASTAAAFATARFNLNMQREDWSSGSESLREKVLHNEAYFDARVFSVPDSIGAAEAILWRHRYDCRRNAINSIGFAHFSAQSLANVSAVELAARLRSEKNIDPFTHYPLVHIYGAFVKKGQYRHAGFNPVSGQGVETLRSRAEPRVIDLTMSAEEAAELILAKYWKTGHPESLASCQPAQAS